MKKALTFAGAFLAVTLFIFLLVFGLNIDSFKSLFENQEGIAEGSEWVEKTYSLKGLSEYIEEFPEKVSIASITPGRPDSSLFLRENSPRPMGTLSNLFLLIGYADAFEQGTIDPAQTIDWGQVSRFQLPHTGENIHKNAWQEGRDRNLIDAEGSLTIESALRLLSKHNSLALSDYLLTLLGEDRVGQILSRLNLEQTDLPLPFSGLMITLSPAVQEISADSILRQWQREPYELLARTAYTASADFADGPERSGWLKILEHERLGLTFIEERNLLALFPKTTAAGMVGILSDILNGELISAEVSRRVEDWLRYPMEERALTRNFREYGAMYDNRMGLLNGIDFGVSTYNGKAAVQAVFFDRLHVAIWLHMSSNHMHQDFQQRLIWDPALYTVMKEVAQNAGSQNAE